MKQNNIFFILFFISINVKNNVRQISALTGVNKYRKKRLSPPAGKRRRRRHRPSDILRLLQSPGQPQGGATSHGEMLLQGELNCSV